MPIYLDVTTAAQETATKILAQRSSYAGRRYRVHIGTGGGATAAVQWDHAERTVALHLPSLPASAWLSRAEADRITGFVIHECCHVLHSGWHVWTEAVRAGARVQLWTNCLEDVRIEKLEIDHGHYPAMRGLLARVSDNLFMKARASGQPIGRDVKDAAHVCAVLGRMRNGYAVPSATGLEASLSKPCAKLVRRALDALPACQSTADVLTLAKKLAKAEAAAEQQQQQQQQQQKGQDGQQDGQAKQDGRPGQPQDAGQPQDGPGQPQDGPGQPQDGQDGPGQPQGHGGGRTLESLSDLASLAADVAKANGATPGEAGSYTLHGWTVEHGQGRHSLTEALAGKDNLEMRAKLPTDETAARAMLNARVPGRALLGQEITRMLVCEEQRRVTHRETSGRLDRRALSRMAAGAQDVFARRTVQPGRDVALGVLWDLSSSMRTERTEMAAATVWQLAQAAEGAGAGFGVYGFSSRCRAEHHGPHGLLVPIWPFGTRPAQPASVLADVFPRGGTRLAPCLLGLAQVMLDVPASRRIMLVLTDGGCDYGYDMVRDACALARQWGVEPVGLGIQAETAVKAFPPGRSVNVDALAELGRTGMRVIADLLEEGAAD